MNLFESLIITSILGGTALIPFVDLVTKDIKSAKLTYVIAFLSSLAVGTLVAFLQGKVMFNDPTAVFTSMGIVFGISQTIFKLYWQSSIVRLKLFSPKPTIQPLAEQGIINPPKQ